MDNLKPCPLCGSSHVTMQLNVPKEENIYDITCENCDLHIVREGKDIVMRDWNSRPGEAVLEKRIAALEQRLAPAAPERTNQRNWVTSQCRKG